MESLTRAQIEAVGDEFLIRSGALATEDPVASITRVAEQGMAYVGHVDTYLVGATGLEDAFHEGDMAEVLERLVVGDSVLAGGIIGRKHTHLQAILGITAYIAFDSAG